jgi:hypothetical protein
MTGNPARVTLRLHSGQEVAQEPARRATVCDPIFVECACGEGCSEEHRQDWLCYKSKRPPPSALLPSAALGASGINFGGPDQEVGTSRPRASG